MHHLKIENCRHKMLDDNVISTDNNLPVSATYDRTPKKVQDMWKEEGSEL